MTAALAHATKLHAVGHAEMLAELPTAHDFCTREECTGQEVLLAGARRVLALHAALAQLEQIITAYTLHLAAPAAPAAAPTPAGST